MNLIVLIFGESSSGHPKNIAVSVLKYSVINNDNLLLSLSIYNVFSGHF